MNKLLLLSLLTISISSFAQTNAEILDKLGGPSSGDGVCADTKSGVPANDGKLVNREAYIYFPEGVSESTKIKEVLKTAKEQNLSPYSVHGVASLIPWGNCKGDQSSWDSFEKLKSCNEPLARKRAENVQKYAKEMFSGINQVDDKKITSEVGFSNNCKIYDKEKEDVYHKYQYIKLKFTTPKCTSGKIYYGAKNLAMKGGKCSGICTDSTSSKLGDGTQCSRYIRFKENTNIKLNAMVVPDRFKMFKVEKCGKGPEVFDTGYTSSAQPYFANPNSYKLAEGSPPMKLSSLRVNRGVFEYFCTKNPFLGVVPDGVSCKRFGSGFYCYGVGAGYRELKSKSQCEKKGQLSFRYKYNFNEVSLDYKNKKMPNFGVIKAELLSISSNKPNIKKSDIEAKPLREFFESNQSGLKSSAESNLNFHYYKKYDYKKIKVLVKDSKGIERAHHLNVLESAYNNLKTAGISPSSVKFGPVPHTVEKGDYCLQVEAPVNNTRWTAE